MNYTKAKLSINAIGHWNKKIFTPQWIATKILGDSRNKKENEKLEINGIIDSNNLELSYDIKNLVLSPRANCLIIEFEEKETEIIRGTKLLDSILKILPETPIAGVIFDVTFYVDQKGNEVIKNVLNKIQLPSLDLNVEGIISSKKESHCTQNIVIKKDKSGYTVSFNYYHTLVQMKGCYNENLFVDYWKRARDLFHTIE